MQCTARRDAVHCRDGCSALQGRLQCTASEMGKTGTEIVSPILDKRKGRRDTPHMGHSSPPDLGSVDIPWGIIEPVLRHRCPH